MLIDLTNKLIKPLTIIALVSLVITWAFNVENVLVTEATYNGITIKILDLRTYLNNLSNAWESNALDFNTIIPSRDFINTGNFIENISNNMLALFDWIYFPINFILYFGRWGAWLFKLLLSIVGWNTGTNANGEYYSSLAEIFTWITQNLFIPYV